MKKVFAAALVVLGTMAVFTSCKKETEELDAAQLEEYFPIKQGNVWIYRIDSILLAPFGAALVERSYQLRDSVVSTFSDNQGRPSYIIYRSIRDTAATKPWWTGGTIYATVTDRWVEYVENNLRYVKLSKPIKEGYSWYGHAFIDTHDNSDYKYLDKKNGWDYTYEKLGEPFTVLNKTYDSTLTVAQNDEVSPAGPFDPNHFKQRLFGKEVYAKGIGLIYKEFLFWTWQPNPNGHYEDNSFGIRLRLISHR
ncbi:hypothetical protein [Aridibaculum aurantiacum]|uniref:hypothetical protein n=1 Tax=Aridibaculum aurantiacum TaxID=2810307 RepID=UPI001A9583CA|nr:hypothetical protein [Aridibaculum aurantiacum]